MDQTPINTTLIATDTALVFCRTESRGLSNEEDQILEPTQTK